MPFVSSQLIALSITVFMLTAIAVGAQTVSPSNAAKSAGASPAPSEAAQLTGKERLGEKWTDEQRIDNCKVSLDKRGTKARPDRCAHAPTD
jgi:hypothetical protein